MKRKMCVALLALLLAGCWPGKPVTDKKIETDGTFRAGTDITYGTWETANASPKTEDRKCEWMVSKPVPGGGTVDLRSGDTDNRIQKVYIGPTDIFVTSNCGTWVWRGTKNDT